MPSGLLRRWRAGPAAVQKAVANAIVAEITVALLKLFSKIKKARRSLRRRGAGGRGLACRRIVVDVQHRPGARRDRGGAAARRHFQLFRAET
ncbi:MAG: hypothetical protein H7Z39_13940 [Burkholderiaceae bacterium]|nr:hypothetical protein [Burkholderiaceae bacterium]